MLLEDKNAIIYGVGGGIGGGVPRVRPSGGHDRGDDQRKQWSRAQVIEITDHTKEVTSWI